MEDKLTIMTPTCSYYNTPWQKSTLLGVIGASQGDGGSPPPSNTSPVFFIISSPYFFISFLSLTCNCIYALIRISPNYSQFLLNEKSLGLQDKKGRLDNFFFENLISAANDFYFQYRFRVSIIS